MSVKVIDLNEATTEVKDEPVIEEATETIVDTANEVIEEATEPTPEPKEEAKEEVKPKPKPKAKPKATDIVPCPDCNKTMTYKNLRYSHKCSPEPPPVKPHAKPKAKQPPKPKPVPVYEEEEEARRCPATSREAMPQAVIRQQPPPVVNPLTNIQQHYQLLQQQYMKQKQEKYNNLCQNMFKAKPKKR